MLEGRGWLNGISLEHALVECGRYSTLLIDPYEFVEHADVGRAWLA